MLRLVDEMVVKSTIRTTDRAICGGKTVVEGPAHG
jgi:hypothetical protein